MVKFKKVGFKNKSAILEITSLLQEYNRSTYSQDIADYLKTFSNIQTTKEQIQTQKEIYYFITNSCSNGLIKLFKICDDEYLNVFYIQNSSEKILKNTFNEFLKNKNDFKIFISNEQYPTKEFYLPFGFVEISKPVLYIGCDFYLQGSILERPNS